MTEQIGFDHMGALIANPVDTDHPSFADFDLYHAGISGGKDSTALALWLRFESGLPLEKIDLTFCDTGNEDPLTYAYLDLLRRVIAPLQIRVITPERDFWELARHKKRFPSTKARFCTIELKVVPTREEVQRLLSDHNVLVMNGVRRAEGHSSNKRKNAAEWEFDLEGWGTWIHRPMVEWSIDQVRDIQRKYIRLEDVIALVWADPDMAEETKLHLATKMAERGIPDNPLYTMGATRVGCFPCINSRKAEIRAMDKYRPERIDYIETKEFWVGEVNFGISTFFPRGYIPLFLNTKTVTIKEKDYTVPTIRDVVNWSKTARGGKQYDMDFDMPASLCDIGGMCE